MKKRLFTVSFFILIVFSFAFFRAKAAYQKIFVSPGGNFGSLNDESDSKYKLFSREYSGDLKDTKSFNVLLLGYGGGSHEGAYLTDSIVVAHIDPINKIATIISIPRDIWVKLPTDANSGSYWKINAAYAVGLNDAGYPNKPSAFKNQGGGGNMAKYAVEQLTGLKIDRFVALDFNGFVKTIDALGGVDVYLDNALDDYEYPIDGKEKDLCGINPNDLENILKISESSPSSEVFPCRYEHLHYDKGNNHLNGENALKLVRSRHSVQDGSDFGRSKRQREVINSAKERVFSLNFIPKIPSFINILEDHVVTDFSLDEVKNLLTYSKIVSDFKIKNFALTDQNFLVDSFSSDGQYILVPINNKSSFTELQDYLKSYLNVNVAIDNPIIKISNGSGKFINTKDLISNLKSINLNAGVVPNHTYEITDKTSITVFSNRMNKDALNKLKNLFEGTEVTEDSKEVPYDILITLGKNYTAPNTPTPTPNSTQ